ncbi:MAG: amidohydrolase family protein [Firmicutes bacterium]|nr:amidohydrolase family protein [Bacillota bacterium]MCL5038248.1 amidohydrolase family protein [Bacillota bacterium]
MGKILLRGARLIDGTGRPPQSEAAVLLEGNRITAVGPQEEVSAAEGARVYDLEGKTLLPGLIDCHVHISMEPDAEPTRRLREESDLLLILRGARNAWRSLQAGYTTLRSLGGRGLVDLELKRAIQGGVINGARLLVAGQLLTMTGGHGHFIGREVDGPHQLRQAAREEIKKGADVIKVMATGGVLTPGVEPGSAQLTREEMQAAIEEAHKAGKKTAAHAQGSEGIKNAILAGVDSIEHGMFLTDEIIDLMLQRKVFLVPTLAAAHHIFYGGREHGIPEYAIKKTERVMEAHWQSLQRAHRAGVLIAAGTDAGTPLNAHGQNAFELELLVKAGFSPMEAIQAATSRAAQLLGREDLGTIEVGRIADLVVVDGDPLVDIRVLREKVSLVFQDGRPVERGLFGN